MSDLHERAAELMTEAAKVIDDHAVCRRDKGFHMAVSYLVGVGGLAERLTRMAAELRAARGGQGAVAWRVACDACGRGAFERDGRLRCYCGWSCPIPSGTAPAAPQAAGVDVGQAEREAIAEAVRATGPGEAPLLALADHIERGDFGGKP